MNFLINIQNLYTVYLYFYIYTAIIPVSATRCLTNVYFHINTVLYHNLRIRSANVSRLDCKFKFSINHNYKNEINICYNL